MVLLQSGQCLFTDVHVADTFWKRFCGLMCRKSIKVNEALFLQKCSSIHTCFMRFPIDVVYLDSSLNVLFSETVVPWRMGRFVKAAKHVVEIPEGKAELFKVGLPIDIRNMERKDYHD